MIVGVVCALAAPCRAEPASAVPVAGSACTLSFATPGELAAWTVGRGLVLGLTVLPVSGVRLSRRINQVVTAVEPAAVLLGIVVGLGFDVIATTGEEAENPQRILRIGILGALAIVTALCAAVSPVITGMRPCTDIDPADGAPPATSFTAVGAPWVGGIIAVGAVPGAGPPGLTDRGSR